MEGPIDNRFENENENEQSEKMENLSRTVWNFKINEKGKKEYGTMYTKTNQFYFDNKTLMTTPIDHETLNFIINSK